MKKLPFIVLFIFTASVFVTAQSAFENSLYMKGAARIVDGGNQYFIVGDSTGYLGEDYQYNNVNALSYPDYFQLSRLNTKGFWGSGKFRFYVEDNLGYYPCGDVWFQNFSMSLYDPVADSWWHKYWDCPYGSSDETLCNNLYNDDYEFYRPFFEIAPINATDVFLLFGKSFIRIYDTIPSSNVSRPVLDVPALFPTTSDIESFKINKGLVLDSVLVLFTNKVIFKYDMRGDFQLHTPTVAHPVYNQNISQAFKINDSTAVYAHSSLLYSVNKNLATNFLFDYSTYLDTLVLVKEVGDRLWLMGTNPFSYQTRFIVLDSALNFSTYDFPLDEVFPLEFRVDSTQLVLIGNETVSPFGDDFSLTVKSYNLNQVQDSFLNDASISSYNLDVFYARVSPMFAFVGQWKTISANLEFTIFNYGIDTLKSVIVKANFLEGKGGDFCHNYSYFQRNLNGQHIPPQGSQTFSFDSIQIRTSTKNNLNFCVWTASPNGRIDKDHSNDAVCGQHIIVSAQETILTEKIGVYPNPVEDLLYLECEGKQVLSIRVFSIQGKKIEEHTVNPEDNIAPISVGHFSSGVYFLQVQTRSETVSYKIIKN